MKKELSEITLKDDLSLYSEEELKLIAKEIGITNYKSLSKTKLMVAINKKQVASTINSIHRAIDLQNTSGGFVGLLLDLWFEAFYRNKWLTVISTILLFGAIVFGAIYSQNQTSKGIAEIKRENLDFNRKINELDAIQSSLKDLITFTEEQKYAITETAFILDQLKEERQELEPIVNTERATVEAILSQQEKRNEQNKWTERLIGFGLGLMDGYEEYQVGYGFVSPIVWKNYLKKIIENKDLSEKTRLLWNK